uniref:Uncharacterized protein n=1 Tax=Cucumis melo TaxID=3656 RepID=A0A9I9E9J6_CUCME
MHSASGTTLGIRELKRKGKGEERNEDLLPFRRRCHLIGNEQVANSSMDSIKTLDAFPHGMHHYLEEESPHLVVYLIKISHRRVRVMALVVKLISVSSFMASAVYNANLLGLLESEINNLQLYYDQHDDLIDIRSSYLFNSIASQTTLMQDDRLQYVFFAFPPYTRSPLRNVTYIIYV